jgi:hypothetical protein
MRFECLRPSGGDEVEVVEAVIVELSLIIILSSSSSRPTITKSPSDGSSGWLEETDDDDDDDDDDEDDSKDASCDFDPLDLEGVANEFLNRSSASSAKRMFFFRSYRFKETNT